MALKFKLKTMNKTISVKLHQKAMYNIEAILLLIIHFTKKV